MIHSILFTGHMIDAPGRREPRFPAAKEGGAREAIKRYLKDEKAAADQLRGIAGAACGGDILFQELCMELGIASEIYLALSVEEFKKKSVAFAGTGWEKRYERLVKELPVHLLPPPEDKDSVWEKANLWMLGEALKNGGEHMTLIALWDGKGGDGSGGTQHMIEMTRNNGAVTKIIDINKL